MSIINKNNYNKQWKSKRTKPKIAQNFTFFSLSTPNLATVRAETILPIISRK